ncbi:MAG TPA: hypothetical protein VKW08_27000 [Xanthobacteraceae bacterium]|nr:hypothetical protein [Xanthobacteraceae bacterium]
MAGAGHGRSLFEPRVHAAESSAKQEIDEWHELEGLDEDHPGECVDIDRIAQAEELERRLVDEPDIGARDQDPRNGDQNARNDDASDQQETHEACERRIGARERPGHEGTDHGREQRGREGKAQAVRADAPEGGAPEGAHIIGEREREGEEVRLAGARLFEARPDNHRERNDHLIGQHRNQERQRRLLEAEAHGLHFGFST